jgi:DNA-binding FadR family transcriptional regulator
MVETAIRPRRVRRATLTSQSEGALRQDIIEGVFTPGQRLTNLELAERYGVSATPLREALKTWSRSIRGSVSPSRQSREPTCTTLTRCSNCSRSRQ